MNSAEEDFHGQAEVVSLICSKVRQALEGRLGAQLAYQCFAIYEYGLASGVFGESSAITRG
ncbi:hypothetical protein AAB990_39580, partial [Burkholderia contaminans]